VPVLAAPAPARVAAGSFRLTVRDHLQVM